MPPCVGSYIVINLNCRICAEPCKQAGSGSSCIMRQIVEWKKLVSDAWEN